MAACAGTPPAACLAQAAGHGAHGGRPPHAKKRRSGHTVRQKRQCKVHPPWGRSSAMMRSWGFSSAVYTCGQCGGSAPSGQGAQTQSGTAGGMAASCPHRASPARPLHPLRHALVMFVNHPQNAPGSWRGSPTATERSRPTARGRGGRPPARASAAGAGNVRRQACYSRALVCTLWGRGGVPQGHASAVHR